MRDGLWSRVEGPLASRSRGNGASDPVDVLCFGFWLMFYVLYLCFTFYVFWFMVYDLGSRVAGPLASRSRGSGASGPRGPASFWANGPVAAPCAPVLGK